MSISVACPHCGAAFRVKDSYAGRRGACPRCRGVIEVSGGLPDAKEESTAPVAATAPDEIEGDTYPVAPLDRSLSASIELPHPTIVADDEGALHLEFVAREPTLARACAAPRTTRVLRPADLAAAFRGDVGRLRPGLGYQLGLLMAALVMLLIPALYAALVIGAAYAVYLWGSSMAWLLRFGWYFAVFYVGGLVGLAVTTLFLLKPLVRWERRGTEPIAVHRSEEPLLFELVDQVCQAVRARVPRRIELVCEATAFVRFRHPFRSMLSGNIVLGLGLPLIGGLRIDQLAGVIAHELGHANQFVGMRLHGLVMHVYLWISRQVHEEDGFDEAIDEWTSSEGFVAPLLGLAAAAGVMVSRGLMRLMLPLALSVARFLSRRQEFDADRYWIRLVGSEGFCTTHRSILLLNHGHATAIQALAASLERGAYPGHLPGLTVEMSRQLREHGVVPPRPEDMPRERSRLFDTHPADAARMQRAIDEAAEPLLVLKRPARELLSDFDTLSEAATRRFLKDLFGDGGDD